MNKGFALYCCLHPSILAWLKLCIDQSASIISKIIKSFKCSHVVEHLHFYQLPFCKVATASGFNHGDQSLATAS